MSCSDRTLSDVMTVWTVGRGIANDVFVPFFEVDTRGIETVRASFLILSSTGSLAVRPAVQYSDDRQTWDTPATFGPASTTTVGTWQYGVFYSAVSAAGRYARYGVACGQAVVGASERGQVNLRLDLRG